MAQYAMQSIYAEGLCFMGYPYLAQLSQRPEYRQAASILAEEITRKWIRFQCTGDKEAKAERIQQIKDEFERLKVKDRCRDALEHDSIFGKGQIFVDFGDGEKELASKLVPDKLKVTRKIERLAIIEPMWTYPAQYNATNPLSPEFYNPSSWYAMSTEVHSSRLLQFVSNPLPDILKPAYLFGGLSLLQMLKPYVDNWLETRQNVNQVIKSFITYVLKSNLSSILNEGSGAEELARAAIFNGCKTNQDLLMIDKDTEDFVAVSAPLGGLDHLQAQAQEHMCSVSRLPLVKFTGISPSGLNASGETELMVFYDHIAAEQEKDLRINLTFIFQLVQVGLFGEVDPEITFDFIPMHEMSEKEQVDMEKARTDADVAYITSGVLSPEEVRARLAEDESSPYNGIDVEAVPEEPGVDLETEPELEPEPKKDPAKDEVNIASFIGQIKKGFAIEKEHYDTVDGNEETIIGIVIDHLRESLEYYDKLEVMESDDKTEE
jgi:hypothetical protein